MEDSYIISGGKPLHGTVHLSGAKNASYKLIIAALLLDQETVINNVPRIKDVFELFHLIESIGGKASFTDKNTVKVDGRGINTNTVDLLFASKIRGSFMLFAPLLYKLKEAYIPNPGGCRLGARSIDRIIDGMIALGVNVTYSSETGYYHATMNEKPHGTYHFIKPSHTGTELLIMLSVFASNTVKIENAALEPEIDDLILFFNEAGAKIKREHHSIIIEGVEFLHRHEPFHVSADRNEAVTYACMALATKGEVTIHSIEEYKMKAFNEKILEAGGGVEEVGKNTWKYYYKGPLKAVDITTDAHPGFMTDWQPPFAVLMTQAEGESIIHERMMENRFSSVPELRKIGAKIEFIDIPVENPKEFYHFNFDLQQKYETLAVKIDGPQKLHNGVLTVADLRAGATLAIAALTAEGESVINNVTSLERGYEDFIEKVRGLGGDIKKV